MTLSWIKNVAAKPGVVLPLYGDGGVAALMCWPDGVATLRMSESVVRSENDISSLISLAKQNNIRRIETQSSFAKDGAVAQLLIQRGFFPLGYTAVHFKVRIATALQRVEKLRQRFGDRGWKIASPDANFIAQIGKLVETDQLLDDFELQARLVHDGPGTIHIHECSVMLDDLGLAGFVLISEVTDPTERELIVRWVAPRHRGKAVANFYLMLEALERAAAANVSTAYFSANPQRHGDTMRLAVALQAERCGESVALGFDLD